MLKAGIPDFDDLPKVEGQPQGNAWGLWGPDDQIGSTFRPPEQFFRSFD